MDPRSPPRRHLLLAGAAAGALPALASGRAPKTLRLAYNVAETGFDPPQVSDQSSVQVNAHIFEPLLTYDYLARPARLQPLTATALPEVSADFRRFVFTVRPGIFFADDPVFKGQPRELVAADYAYSIRRFYDPRWKSEHLYEFENAKILGLSELRQQALKGRAGFDYDAPVDGLRVLDRYRLELRLADPAPRFTHVFASPLLAAAVAREVVDAYGDDLMAHPVGTGPFRLVQWRRGSLIVLERNPRYREEVFDASGAADQPDCQAAAAHLAGQRLPLLDRVEISIVNEAQPRWLAFAGGQHDLLQLPPEFAPIAVPGGRVAPHLAKRGVRAQRTAEAVVAHTFFNCADPVVGGYTPEKVALRRAISMAHDTARMVDGVLNGQAVVAQSMIPPHCYGHDTAYTTRSRGPAKARAQALLDTYGYLDRDGDGWREAPDGSPLVLRKASPEDQRSRAFNDIWRASMNAIGLRIEFEVHTFGDLIKRSLAGQLPMWGFAWTASEPDGDFFLGLAYGPNGDQSNDARFRLPAFDALYQRQRRLPDGPERLALIREAQRSMHAWAPYLPHYHPITTDLLAPAVRGYVRHPFRRDELRFVDMS